MNHNLWFIGLGLFLLTRNFLWRWMLWRCSPLKNIKSVTEIKSKNGISRRMEKSFWILFRNCKHFIIFPFMNFSYLITDNDVIIFNIPLVEMELEWWGYGILTTCISDEIMTPWGDYVVTVFFIKDLYTREFKLSPSSFQIKEIMPNPAISQIHCLTILFRNNKIAILEILEISKWKCRVG